MKDLYSYITEMINLDDVREYINVKRLKGAEKYMGAFWESLREYANSHGGYISRNGYRIYLPYTGPKPEVKADDDESAGSRNEWSGIRTCIKDTVIELLKKKDQWVPVGCWHYIEGTCDVAMNDQNGNTKIRPNQKIGKILGNAKDPETGKPLADFFSNDPIRLGKNITSAINSNNLWIVISNHAYDIAGMSANRDWTSCMNILGGDNRQYVKYDIKYGTLIAYIIDKKDTNIEHPYGRVLIKPYKLQRPSHIGMDAAPIVYSPEVTVYSPYLGLKPIREWLKDICQELQEGDGILRSLKTLYNDTYHDQADKEWHGKRGKKPEYTQFK